MNQETKKILIVEDDTDLRNVLADRLSSYNYQVLQAGDGEQAMVLIVQHKPDLILLDLLLPKMDGFTVLENVRYHSAPDTATAKVIILSNLWSNKDILRVKALQIDDYCVKANTNLEEVFDKVKKTLHKE
jgi:DNA-binding response OmpR family regulator